MKHDMPEIKERTIFGDHCFVEVFHGGKMRFLSTGTLCAVSKLDIKKAKESGIYVERYPDMCADFSIQCLIPWETKDEDMAALHDEMLNRIERVLGLEESSVSSSAWNAGHSDTKWDHIMTEEEQRIVQQGGTAK